MTKNGKFVFTLMTTSVVALAANPMGAHAATVNATTLIDDYNAIVFQNLTSSSEIEGATLVGGNVSGGNYQIHSNTPNVGAALTVGGNLTGNVNTNAPGLTVGGNISTSNLNLNGGGNVYVGGNLTSSWNANLNGNGNVYVGGSALSGANVTANGGSIYLGGTQQPGANLNANGGGKIYTNSKVPATVIPNVAAQVGADESALKAYSSQLGSLAANSSYSESGSTITFNAAPNANGVAIFDITSGAAKLLNSASQFQFSLNGAKEVIINVEGVGSTTLNLDASFLNSVAQTLGSDTIWNFTDATTIDVDQQFGGTILATAANITTSGNIEGTVIANSLSQGAEIHDDNPQVNQIFPVPLPGALALFATAIAGLLGFNRRRKSGLAFKA